MAWEAEKRPKIALCIPHKSSHCTLEWAECYNRLLLPPPYRVLHRRGPLPIDKARNTLVEEALKEDPEWILFWDNDVIPPQPDVVYRLLAHCYPICSVLYPDKPSRAATFRLKGGRPEPVPWSEVVGRVSFVDAVGFGMVLIDARVFRLAKKRGLYPYFRYLYDPVEAKDKPSEDQYFCLEVARKLGIPILLDGRIVCHHIFTGKLIDDKRITYLVP